MLLRKEGDLTVPEKRTFRNPRILAVLLTLLQLAFPVVSGVMISVFQPGEAWSRGIQAVFFLLAAILGGIIAWRLFGTLHAVGIRAASFKNAKAYFWFLPIVGIELSTLVFGGLKKGLSFRLILIYLLFTMAVGFSEELYFRGLIPNILNGKSLIRPLLVSSFLFSIGHFFNLLAGAGLPDTLLQVLFAFLFGVVALEIRILTGSLAIPVVWHVLHNFFSLITWTNDGSGALLLGWMQGTVLFFYGIYLWKQLRSKNDAVRIGG